MKRTWTLAFLTLALAALLVMTSCESKPKEIKYEPIELDFDIIATDISTAISDYYYSKDISGSFDANDIFSSDLVTYLEDKVETNQYADEKKENYNIEVNLIDHATEADSNIIFFQFQAVESFNYVGRDFDSGTSDVVNVKYDIKKQKIVDVYIPFDYYDEHVRGEQNTTSDNGEFELTPDIVSKQEELHQKLGME